MNMRIILLFVVGLLLISSASAFSTSLNAVNETSSQIFFDEVAYFNLEIKNTDEVSRVFTWSVNPVEWIIDTPKTMRVEAGETKTAEIQVRPRPSNYRGPGVYSLPLTINSNDEFNVEPMTIRIRSIYDSDYSYTPSIALGASVNDPLDPREVANVQVLIRNRNMLEIDEMLLVIDGTTFYEEFSLSLGGLEEKTLEYLFDIDPLIEPGKHELHVFLRYDGKIVSEVKKFYDISPYTVIDRDVVEKSLYFKKTQVATLTNEGNIPKRVATDVKMPWYKAPFMRVEVESIQYEKIKRGSWDLLLEPQEVAIVTVTENYRSLPIIAVIIILIILGYFQFRSPIVLMKQTVVTGKDEEGVSEMKVRVFIKNRTAKAFYNLRLLDRAPSIAHVKMSEGLGVIEPTKIIRNEKRGTIIKWDFDSIEAYEERIVTYTIKARLKIIGNLGLPPVKAKFENVSGKQRTTASGRAVIGTKS